jgi:CRISPR-associated protein (TIGR03986 family)
VSNYFYDNGNQSDQFVNPYNFISLSANCNKTVDGSKHQAKEELSGTISVELETLTPLFIPNTTTEKAFPSTNTVNQKTTSGKAYDFFSYEDLAQIIDCTSRYARPIVPGSSIRGAVRAAFEAVTNSCLSTCDDNVLLHRRANVAKSQYGILTKGANGYQLFNARKVMLNTAVYHGKTHSFGAAIRRSNYHIDVEGTQKKTGDTVYIRTTRTTYMTSRGFRTPLCGVDRLSAAAGRDLERGILFLGERFQRKHHDSVFIRLQTSHMISSDDYNRFFNVWKQYQADSPGSYPNYITLNEIPVYFSTVGATLYMSPACISKEVFDAKLSTLLGDHSRCLSANAKICPACALFGLISDEKDGALASRLMFRDAVPIGYSEENPSDFYEEPRQLPILGTPKISATEFYTEDYRSDYKVWNYDYGRLRRQNQPKRFSPKLRGRKFYWHKKELTPSGRDDRADLTVKVRAVKDGKKFQFKIMFDRLTKKELDLLLYVLTFGERSSTHAHKLGHGKPIGYGSVKYTVKETQLFKLRDDLTFCPPEDSKYEVNYNDVNLVQSDSLRDYLIMTRFDKVPENISYPKGARGNNSGVYQWFSQNKGSMGNPEFRQVLAKPQEIMPLD